MTRGSSKPVSSLLQTISSAGPGRRYATLPLREFLARGGADAVVFDDVGTASPAARRTALAEAFAPLFAPPGFVAEVAELAPVEDRAAAAASPLAAAFGERIAVKGMAGRAYFVLASFAGGRVQRHAHGAAWNALLYGEKEWRLWPPPGDARRRANASDDASASASE